MIARFLSRSERADTATLIEIWRLDCRPRWCIRCIDCSAELLGRPPGSRVVRPWIHLVSKAVRDHHRHRGLGRSVEFGVVVADHLLQPALRFRRVARIPRLDAVDLELQEFVLELVPVLLGPWSDPASRLCESLALRVGQREVSEVDLRRIEWKHADLLAVDFADVLEWGVDLDLAKVSRRLWSDDEFSSVVLDCGHGELASAPGNSRGSSTSGLDEIPLRIDQRNALFRNLDPKTTGKFAGDLLALVLLARERGDGRGPQLLREIRWSGWAEDAHDILDAFSVLEIRLDHLALLVRKRCDDSVDDFEFLWRVRRSALVPGLVRLERVLWSLELLRATDLPRGRCAGSLSTSGLGYLHLASRVHVTGAIWERVNLGLRTRHRHDLTVRGDGSGEHVAGFGIAEPSAGQRHESRLQLAEHLFRRDVVAGRRSHQILAKDVVLAHLVHPGLDALERLLPLLRAEARIVRDVHRGLAKAFGSSRVRVLYIHRKAHVARAFHNHLLLLRREALLLLARRDIEHLKSAVERILCGLPAVHGRRLHHGHELRRRRSLLGWHSELLGGSERLHALRRHVLLLVHSAARSELEASWLAHQFLTSGHTQRIALWRLGGQRKHLKARRIWSSLQLRLEDLALPCSLVDPSGSPIRCVSSRWVLLKSHLVPLGPFALRACRRWHSRLDGQFGPAVLPASACLAPPEFAFLVRLLKVLAVLTGVKPSHLLVVWN